jgi:hypothetical protein
VRRVLETRWKPRYVAVIVSVMANSSAATTQCCSDLAPEEHSTRRMLVWKLRETFQKPSDVCDASCVRTPMLQLVFDRCAYFESWSGHGPSSLRSSVVILSLPWRFPRHSLLVIWYYRRYIAWGAANCGKVKHAVTVGSGPELALPQH